MVDSVVTKQELINAQKDAQSLEDVINGPADTRVKPRIGPEMWTLATINSLVQQGQIKISDLSEAIQIALAAGAGSAGWTADLVADGNQNQAEINLYGGKEYDMPAGGYPVGGLVRLENGDIVKSTIPNNTNDPNVDMIGWVKANDASQIFYGLQNQAQINARTVTPYDFGAIGDGLAHPLSERYATLAAAQAVYPSASSLTEYIDGHAFNMWWRDVCAVDRKNATAHGKFRSSTTIGNVGLNSLANIIRTRRVDFNAQLIFEPTEILEYGFIGISPRQNQVTGFFEVLDAGGVDWSKRKVNNLIYIEDFIHSSFNWKVVTKYARKYGLFVFSGTGSLSGGYANNNTSDLGSWQFGSCGHRFENTLFNFTARTDIGASNGTDQRTILTVTEPLPFDNVVDGFINFGGKPYMITANTANTVTVYPWITELDNTGTFRLTYGGDFKLVGADSNQIKMSSGSADCAICAGGEGFYVGTKLQRTNEGNDIGLRLGNGVNNAQIGGTYLGTYFELNVFDIVKTNVNADNAIIINPIALNESKCFSLTPIAAVSRKPSPVLLSSWNVIYGDKSKKRKSHQYYDGTSPNTTLSVILGDEPFKLRANAAILTLTDNAKFRSIYGNVDVEFEIFGTAVNNGTLGLTTIKCESGYTINGVAADLVIPTTYCAFKVSARLVNETDWRVYVFYAEKPIGSKTYDPPSIAAGASVTTTLSVLGVTVGTVVQVGFSQYHADIRLYAVVSAANTVTVEFKNVGSSAVDLPSGTIKANII